MKICFITSTIFNLGGVQRVVSVLANELSKYHQIDIICTNKEYKLDRELYSLSKKVNVEFSTKLNDKFFLIKLYSGLGKRVNKKTGWFNNEKMLSIIEEIYYPKQVQKNYINYFNNKKYDIIIGVEGYYSLLLGIISKSIKSKVIGWQHNSYEAYLKNTRRYYWNQDILFKKYLQNLDKFLVLTNHDKNKYYEELHIKSEVIYNPRSFKSNNKSNLLNKKFIAAGRFTYQKGFDLLLSSFQIFSESNNEWNLDIFGEGEEEETLLDLIRKYNLEDRVRIKKFTNKIKEYLLDSSVLLLSSRWEGMPMIVLESMELGLPIISYDITASQQLIQNNEQGILVNKYDTDKFADAMLQLAQSYELRKKYSTNAIKKSREFDIESIAKKWNKMFYEIM